MTSIMHASAAATAERKRACVAAVALIASPILWLIGALAFFTTLGARLYLWCLNGILKSKLPMELWDKRFGLTTTRNWNTVLALGGLLGL